MIPVKVVVNGDLASGKVYIGEAKSQLAILKKQQSLGLRDEIRRVSLSPGVSVTCISDIRGDFIILNAGVGWREEEEKVIKEILRICVCNCNFSTGFVIEVTGTLDDDPDGPNLYSVAACNNEKYYVLYENILASDFTIYEPGDKVVLIPYNASNYSCCTGQNTATGCQPVKSEFDITSDSWRTTYRIIPWCSAIIPKWVEV